MVVLVVWSCVVGWIVVDVVEVVGRAGCSAAHEVTRAVFHCGEPGHVAREILVVPVGSVWLSVDVEVVFPSLGWSSLFPIPFSLG